VAPGQVSHVSQPHSVYPVHPTEQLHVPLQLATQVPLHDAAPLPQPPLHEP
jgi:hypothetical protein